MPPHRITAHTAHYQQPVWYAAGQARARPPDSTAEALIADLGRDRQPSIALGSGYSLVTRGEGGGRDALEGGGGYPPPLQGPATVPLTASPSFNGICNRQ